MDAPANEQNLGDRGFRIRQAFLKYPGEAPEVDYKSGLKFAAGDDFALKLVKHILGMANSGSGGHIVIGYPENAAKHPEAGEISDDIIASYDVSTLADAVEKYRSGTEKIKILVHKDKHPDTGQVYPIIEVAGFEKAPFFCKSSAGGILEENALYIRIAAARTIKVASPTEWEQLIDIVVNRRQGEVLQRFTALAREMGLNPSGSKGSSTQEAANDEWRASLRAEAKAAAEAAGFKFEGLEISHIPEGSTQKWTQKELLDAMGSSALNHTGWPIGLVMHTPEHRPKTSKHGVRSSVAFGTETFDYWFLDENGAFYFFRAFEEDSRGVFQRPDSGKEPKRLLAFDTQVWRLAEAIDHTMSLYKALGLPGPTKIDYEIRYHGVRERTLTTSPSSARLISPFVAGDDDFQWSKTTSLDALSGNADQTIIEVAKQLFMNFDFWEPSDTVLQGIIDEYRGSHV